jgi:hypothetical protein
MHHSYWALKLSLCIPCLDNREPTVVQAMTDMSHAKLCCLLGLTVKSRTHSCPCNGGHGESSSASFSVAPTFQRTSIAAAAACLAPLLKSLPAMPLPFLHHTICVPLHESSSPSLHGSSSPALHELSSAASALSCTTSRSTARSCADAMHGMHAYKRAAESCAGTKWRTLPQCFGIHDTLGCRNPSFANCCKRECFSAARASAAS